MDRKLKIAVGDSCRAVRWVNRENTFEELCRQLETTIRTSETVEEYRKAGKAERERAKDKGGFVGGELKDGRRKRENVVCRSLVILDADEAPVGFIEEYGKKVKYAGFLYTTHSHRPEAPRVRIGFPLSRDVTAEEYSAVARYLAQEIGIEYVDACSYQPHQLMYWPTTSLNGEYIFRKYEGEWVDPDAILGAHPEWHDLSKLPASSREGELRQPGKTAQDPREKPGLIGAFCRCYSISGAIEAFLPEIYVPTKDPNRYTYAPGESAAGAVVYDGDTFLYSHHATDPAGGRLLNAFDMVRIHLFGKMDNRAEDGTGEKKLPSYKAMINFAAKDEAVRERLFEERWNETTADEFEDGDEEEEPSGNTDEMTVDPDDGEASWEDLFGEDEDDDGEQSGGTANGDGNNGGPANGKGQPGGKTDEDRSGKNSGKAKKPGSNWKRLLALDHKGETDDSLLNLIVILKNDPNLRGIRYNMLAECVEADDSLPWIRKGNYWRDADDAQLKAYIEKHYGEFSQSNYNDAIMKVADDRSYHPIVQYLEKLPDWDGTPRVDTLLIDYLGAEDSAYTRAVIRKTLCAAIERIYHPGAKFDTMLVLNGPQGIGKSTLIAKLAQEWFSDSLSLVDTKDKTAAEKLQGYWILEIGELAGLLKAEIEILRSFLSRQNDIFRPSYGRHTTPHPRQCVFFGTTNAETGYLRDVTGNRRFWPVKVTGGQENHSWNLDKATIDQIWAEALKYWKDGEQLYLPPDIEQAAKREQKNAMESDEREGIIQDFLEMPLPDEWDEMNLQERRGYIHGEDALIRAQRTGTEKRKTVTTLEVWCECLYRDRASMRRIDSTEMIAMLEKLGWSKRPAKERVPIYGPQYIFEREE